MVNKKKQGKERSKWSNGPVALLMLCTALLMCQSCLDDDITFPEEEVIAVDNSISIVTLLDRINNDGDQSGQFNACLDFVYPITLAFNTGSVVSVNDTQGLTEIARGQSLGLHVTGIGFPFEIQSIEENLSITNDALLLEALLACDLGSFRNDLEEQFSNCVSLGYPVTLLDANDNETIVNTQEEYTAFIALQEALYQPRFEFPVALTIPPIAEELIVEDYWGFYDAFNRCSACPSPLIDVVSFDDGLNFNFFANLRDSDISTYDWVIFQEEREVFSKTNDAEDDLLAFQFSPGTYEVCIAVTTEECPAGIQYCETITAAALCPDPTYESFLIEGPGFYEFKSSVIEEDAIFSWFINDKLITGVRVNSLRYNFLADSIFTGFGRYNVCYEVTSPFCPDTREYCEFLTIKEDCLRLFFESQNLGNNAIEFVADFPLINEIEYQWVVFLENMPVADEAEMPGSDNLFTFQFGQGQYEVCLFAESMECPASQFCQQFNFP